MKKKKFQLQTIILSILCTSQWGLSAEEPIAIININDLIKIRDPFQIPPPIVQKSTQEAEFEEEKNTLEKSPIDAFTVIAISTGPTQPKALIKVPNGESKLVTLQDKMGIREGIITNINPNAIEVTERITNILGQEEKILTILPLLEENQTHKKEYTHLSKEEIDALQNNIKDNPGINGKTNPRLSKKEFSQETHIYKKP